MLDLHHGGGGINDMMDERSMVIMSYRTSDEHYDSLSLVLVHAVLEAELSRLDTGDEVGGSAYGDGLQRAQYTTEITTRSHQDIDSIQNKNGESAMMRTTGSFDHTSSRPLQAHRPRSLH